MARTGGGFDADTLLGLHLGEKYKITLLRREWEINPDLPISLELMWERALTGPSPEDETEADRRARVTREQAEAIDLAYGPGSHDDLIARGGGSWARIVLYRAALAWYRGLDPQEEVEDLLQKVLGADNRDEAAEQAHEDAEGNAEGPEEN